MRRLAFTVFKWLVRLFSGYGLGDRFRPLRDLYAALFASLKPSAIEVGGHKIFLDPRDALRLSWERYEPFETKVFIENIEQGDVVVDLGAHIGYYTLIAAKRVGDEGRVFAFEPDPESFALLEKNVKVNGYTNVTAVKAAVSETTGIGKLYQSAVHSGDQRIYDSLDGRISIEIKMVRLDDFLDERTKVNFIKMDIQGAEGKAFMGMQRILSRNKDIKILTEFWPFGLRQSGIHPEAYLRLMREQGFLIYLLDAHAHTMVPASSEELLALATDDYVTNLLLTRAPI